MTDTITTRPPPARNPLAWLILTVSRCWAWFRARDPVIQLALVAATARTIGLFRHYLGEDLLGHPVAVEPGRFLPYAIPYHVGLLLVVAFPFVAVTHFWPRARGVLLSLACLVFAFLVLFGQVDLEVLRGLGTHLTPSFIAHYVGGDMFTDIGSGLADDWLHLTLSGVLVIVSWVVMWRIRRRHRLTQPNDPWPRWRGLAVRTLVPVGLIAFPHIVRPRRAELRVVVPAEVLLLRPIFTDVRTPEPPDIAAATWQFRADLQGSRNIAFVDDRLPLVHVARPRATDRPVSQSAPRPDIYMIVVESLRGRELHPDHSHPEEHPNLTVLMRRGVTLPYFVSNGFPSSAGYFAMNCSGWPHPSSFVLTEFATHAFDCLPPRLRALGYETTYFTAGNPSIDNQLTWSTKLYDYVHACESHNDRRLVDDFASWLDARDSASPDAGPIFAWLATISTHHPFVVNDPEHPPVASEDLGTRYHDALLYADAHIGRLVRIIEAREQTRRRPAVSVVVGDHAFPVDEDAPPELGSQGCDRRVWTAAIILGPESLIGPPRALEFPASQVDIMPTLLALVGDTGPTSALGHDLLDGQVEGRSAVVVTEGGLRLDLGDTSFFTNLDGSPTWRQDRQHASDCTPGPTPPDAETRERADALITRVQYWSWLVENDRVWPRAPTRP